MRWRRYFATVERSLISGQPPEVIDWFAVEDAWARGRERYPDHPVGDSYTVAAEVHARLGEGLEA